MIFFYKSFIFFIINFGATKVFLAKGWSCTYEILLEELNESFENIFKNNNWV